MPRAEPHASAAAAPIPIPIERAASLTRSASVADVVAAFRGRPGLRAVAVVDDQRRPIGAIQETAIRDLLFNPFGYALLQNPSFGRTLDPLVAPCPTIEAAPSTTTTVKIAGSSPRIRSRTSSRIVLASASSERT